MAELRQILYEVREVRTEQRRQAERTNQLAIDVAVLKAAAPPKSRQLARDGGLAVGGGTLVALLFQVLQAFSQPPDKARPPKTPIGVQNDSRLPSQPR